MFVCREESLVVCWAPKSLFTLRLVSLVFHSDGELEWSYRIEGGSVSWKNVSFLEIEV
jgi:hypothetical protein